MKLKKGFKQYIIGVLSFWIFLFAFYKYMKFEFTKIVENGNFTIGYGKKIEKEKTGRSYTYDYRIKNNVYSGGLSFMSNKYGLKENTRYFVIFEKDNPENAMLLPFLIVPDSITEAPPEGWKELPVPVDNEEIRNFLENY